MHYKVVTGYLLFPSSIDAIWQAKSVRNAIQKQCARGLISSMKHHVEETTDNNITVCFQINQIKAERLQARCLLLICEDKC